MGINFRKSINIAKGIKINLSKGGPSISFGQNGLRFSLNTKGQASGSLGIPGTGLYYNKRVNIFSTIKKFFTGEEDTKAVELENQLNDENLTDEQKAHLMNQMEDNYFERMSNVHKTADATIDWDNVIKTQDPNTEAGKNVIKLATAVLNKDDDAYLTVIHEMQPFADLTEYGSEFEVGIVEDDFLGVSFNINANESIPTTKITTLKSGKQQEKELSTSARSNLIRDYVSSTMIRVARDLFALIPADKVVVNAEDKRVNSATGNMEDVTLASVIFTRDKFDKINFENIVPFDTISSFESNIDFKPTKGGFQEVLPLK